MMQKVSPPPVSMFTAGHLPEPSVERRPNGLTLHTLIAGTQPIVKIQLVWPKGPRADYKLGSGSLMVDTLREGTDRFSGGEIADIIDFNGAVFETRADDHFVILSLVVLSDKAFDVLPVLEQMIAVPTFPEHEFEVIKQRAYTAELLSESRVREIADRNLRPMIFGTSPGHRSLTAADIACVTRRDLMELHRSCFGPGECHAFVSGMADVALMERIVAMLDGMPALGTIPVQTWPMEAATPGRRDVAAEDSMQAAVAIGLPAVPRSHPDFIPLRMVVRAFGGYFGSRLMANIREDKGYTYGITATLNGMLDGSYINVAAECDPAYADDLIVQVGREMERMVSNPPEGEELRRLQLNVMTSLVASLDSPFKTMEHYVSKLIVGLTDGYFDRQQRVILDMTPEDYARIAAKYLRPEQMRIVVAK